MSTYVHSSIHVATIVVLLQAIICSYFMMGFVIPRVRICSYMHVHSYDMCLVFISLAAFMHLYTVHIVKWECIYNSLHIATYYIYVVMYCNMHIFNALRSCGHIYVRICMYVAAST